MVIAKLTIGARIIAKHYGQMRPGRIIGIIGQGCPCEQFHITVDGNYDDNGPVVRTVLRGDFVLA